MDEEKPHICDKCFLLVNSKETLANHQSSCIQSVSTNKNCQNVPQLLQNEKTAHLCDLCGKMFTSKGLLISHRMKCYEMAPQDPSLTCSRPEVTCSRPEVLPEKEDTKIDEQSHRKHEIMSDKCDVKMGQVTVDRKPVICDVCFLAFSEDDEMRMHKVTHSENKESQCDACGKAFISHHSIESHRLICKETKSFMCEICQVTPSEECDQIQHETEEDPNSNKETIGSAQYKNNHDEETGEETWDEKPNICDKCFTTFPTVESLESHTPICAAGEKRYQCCCHLEFGSSETFMVHVQTQHVDSEMFTCPVCRLMVPLVEDLQGHMETHLTGTSDGASVKFEAEPYEPEETREPTSGDETSVKFEAEPYEPEETIKPNNFLVQVPNGDQQSHRCDFCDKSFEQETSLKYHRAMHNTDKPFKCDLCDKTLSSKGNMIQHQQLHSGEKPHKCDQCDKSFNRKSHLKEHKRTHSGEKPYGCTQCEKSFSDRSNLTRHMLIHMEGKPHKCDHCDRTFYRKAHMVQHMRMHSGERPFQCDQCDKSFARKTNLTEHLLWHRNEFPYQCKMCGKSFGNRSTLTNHMQVHMVEKPHECNMCGKSFVTIYRLNRHTLSHSDAKPHKCHFCDKRFNLKTHLTKHVLIHNRCAVCKQSFRTAEDLAVHMVDHSDVNSAGETCGETVSGDSLGLVKEEPIDESEEEHFDGHREKFNHEMMMEESQRNVQNREIIREVEIENSNTPVPAYNTFGYNEKPRVKSKLF